jgi:hypothetical protein
MRLVTSIFRYFISHAYPVSSYSFQTIFHLYLLLILDLVTRERIMDMDTDEHERLPNITLRHETAHVLLFNISQSQYSFSKSYLQKEEF